MSQEIRVAVQHALDKLINRFGKQSDVIEELRHVLALIDKQEKKGVEATVALPAVPEVFTPAISEEAEPPPKAPVTRRSYGGRKK